MTKTCFLFPGQGAQKVGMGHSLYQAYEEARTCFHMADEILGYSLSGLCFEGPQEELNLTRIAQPALLTASIASFQVLTRQRPQISADCFGGLSLGEYSAQVAAGALEFETALKLVQRRAELMQTACEETEGGMVSVIGLSVDQVRSLCESRAGYLTVANLNCPGQIVVSGQAGELEDFSARAKQAGAKRCLILKVAGAFHSRHMDKAAQEFREVLSTVSVRQDRLLQVLSNVTGRCFTETDSWCDLMSRQISSPVLWESDVRWALDQGCGLFYELGPGKTLAGMLKRIDSEAVCRNFETPDQLDLF